MKIKPAWALWLVLAVLSLAAMLLNRPVKVNILENVFIEVGAGRQGPPEFFEKAVVLEDGRTVYLSAGGGCKVR